jgi:hypothetical protein
MGTACKLRPPTWFPTFFLLLATAPTWAQDASQPAQHKPITYLGMAISEELIVSPEFAPVIEQALRQAIEMKRFETIPVTDTGVVSLDQFLAEYRDQLVQKAAAAGPDGTARPVWAKDLERIAGSAFLYQLSLVRFDALVTTDSKGAPIGRVEMSVRLDISRLDLSDPMNPGTEPVSTLGKQVPRVVTAPLRKDESMTIAMLELVKTCAQRVGNDLALQIRRLPQFQLTASIDQVHPDGVTLPMGANFGVQIDDGFEIHRREPGGQQRQVGYVKIRKVEEESAYAENIAVGDGWTFAAGDLIIEDAKFGVGLHLAGLVEVTASDLLGRTGAGVYPGFALGVEIDLAESFQAPEFYFLVDLDHLFLGSAPSPDLFVSLGHVTIGLLKKFNIHRLVLQLGVKVGFSYYLYDDSRFDDGTAGHIGFGGDLLAGAAVFLAPNASLFVNLTGRYFYNPLDWTDASDSELGLRADAGLTIAF